MKRLSSWQIAATAGFLLTYTVMSFAVPRGRFLTVVSDTTGTVLWGLCVAVMLWAAFSNQGRTRWFWILFAGGATLICLNFAAWFYYEVIAGSPTPDPFWADIPLFLQPVPMMAAAAMRPGSRQQEQKFNLSTLNFLILVLWWVYLYGFLIFPKYYILPNEHFANTYSSILFVLEFAVMLAVFGGMALVTQGAWRKIYWHLFFAGALYLITYQWLNAAIQANLYYSGSFYDVPDYAAICYFILIAISARHVPSEELGRKARGHRDIPGTLAALAVLSMPVIGLLESFYGPQPAQLLPFRISVTLVGIFLVAVCVFLRQQLLAREMRRLLLESEQNLEQLQNAQSQLLQQERMAGVGQLVSGVAHELNNPLTAVMGYSDLLVDQASDGAAKQKLQRLGTEARRMKRIIDNLISFARPHQEGRRQLDISVIVRESMMLCEYHLRHGSIAVEMNFAPNLPRISSNEGQLKQVFVNLFSNATHALQDAAEKKVFVEGVLEGEKVIIRFSDTGPGFTDVSRAFDPFYTTRPVGQGTGLGLSMCYGIIREHGGKIQASNRQPNGAIVTIELPAMQESNTPIPGKVLPEKAVLR